MSEDSQSATAVEMLQQAEQSPEIAQFFTGLFEVLAIRIDETGEEFAVRVGRDRIYVEPGMPKDFDFLVPLSLQNVSSMVSYAEDGSLNRFEVWRIVSTLFTPLTRETLKNPMMSNGIMRLIARIESVIHVELVGPEVAHVTRHTLVFAGGQWLVLEGLHGKPMRHFKMTAEESAEYQRQVFKAVKAANMAAWLRFLRWYLQWRRQTSETARRSRLFGPRSAS